ncbi:MAG: XdhC/CoxI family protein [Acidimicrobiales bacterium]
MRDLLRELARWHGQGKSVAWARVIDLEGSGPRDPGAAMAVSAQGEVIGSVSGGCVEGAVVTEALDVLATGLPRLVSFGYSDDDAFAVGLTCGGTVHLYLEPFTGVPELEAAIREHRPAVLATVVDGTGAGDSLLLVAGSEPRGGFSNADLQRVVQRDAEAALAAGTTSVRRYGDCGEANEDTVTVFIEAFAPPPRLLVFGAVDFTAALVRVAKVLGFHVTVCDAREVFATKARFPLADEVVVDWPNRYLAEVGASLAPRDAVCVLTHDAKFDVPAIRAALDTDVGYIGAMGSRRTTEQRAERLRAEGVTDEDLERLMAPIGLDLGARTPEETAVAICAEIIAHRTGRAAPRLSDGTGPIH